MKKVYLRRQQEIPFRPWPILTGLSVFSLAGRGIGFFHLWWGWKDCFVAVLLLLWAVRMWWRDIIRERTFQGEHSQIERKAFWVGFVLFICSEAILFVSFFWAFFHRALAPAVELGCVYPPVGVKPVPVYRSPLTITVVLVTSGVLANRSLHSLKGDHVGSCCGMRMTLLLSATFRWLQCLEYWDCCFTIRDRVFGSVFFLITGFHALHVIAGTTFLFVQYIRMVKVHFSTGHHLGLEIRVWYWHFVDVIWIIVVVFVYGWGGA